MTTISTAQGLKHKPKTQHWIQSYYLRGNRFIALGRKTCLSVQHYTLPRPSLHFLPKDMLRRVTIALHICACIVGVSGRLGDQLPASTSSAYFATEFRYSNWSDSTPSSIPVAATGGGVYVTHNGDLHHLYADGTLGWQTAAGIRLAPVESREGLLYTYCGNSLCAIDSETGMIFWQQPPAVGAFRPQCLAMDGTGTTLITTLAPTDRKATEFMVMAHSLSGEVRWSAALVGWPSSALSGRAGCAVPTADGHLLITHADIPQAYLSKLSNGKVMWTAALPGFASGAPAVDPLTGTAYALVQGDGQQVLVAVSSIGQIQHTIQVDDADESQPSGLTAPLVVEDKVFAVSGPGQLFAFYTATMQPLPRAYVGDSGTPVLAPDGTILIATFDRLLCFGQDAVQRWELYRPTSKMGGSALAVSDGTVFLANERAVMFVAIDGTVRLMATTKPTMAPTNYPTIDGHDLKVALQTIAIIVVVIFFGCLGLCACGAACLGYSVFVLCKCCYNTAKDNRKPGEVVFEPLLPSDQAGVVYDQPGAPSAPYPYAQHPQGPSIVQGTVIG